MDLEGLDWVGIELCGGRYVVGHKLGEGGMAHVYRARDTSLNQDVVVKVPRLSVLEDPRFRKRFERETRYLLKLTHPHVVHLRDVGTQRGIPFVVMQYLAGGSLRDRQPTDRKGKRLPLPLEQCQDWLLPVSQALDFVHAQGYIHRDVKPENILFDEHGHAYLTDFGVMRAVETEGEQSSHTSRTATGTVFGTAHYMAPELILGKEYDGRVDQYALAVTVYHLLSGCFPFDGPNAPAIFVQHTTGSAPDLCEVAPHVPAQVATAIHRALARNPEKRYATCTDFAAAILRPPPRRTPPSSRSPVPSADIEDQLPESSVLPCPSCQKRMRIPPGVGASRARCPYCAHEFLPTIIPPVRRRTDATGTTNKSGGHSSLPKNKSNAHATSISQAPAAARSIPVLPPPVPTLSGIFGRTALLAVVIALAIFVLAAGTITFVLARTGTSRQGRSTAKHTTDSKSAPAQTARNATPVGSADLRAPSQTATLSAERKKPKPLRFDMPLLRTQWKAHKGVVTQLEFLLDNKRIVTGSYGENPVVWDARTGKRLASPQNQDWIYRHFLLFPDEDTLVIGTSNTSNPALTGSKLVYIWPFTESFATVMHSGDYSLSPRSVTADGKRVLVASANELTPNGQVVPARPDSKHVYSVLDKRGRKLAEWTLFGFGETRSLGGIRFLKDGRAVCLVQQQSTSEIMAINEMTGELKSIGCPDLPTRWISMNPFGTNGAGLCYHNELCLYDIAEPAAGIRRYTIDAGKIGILQQISCHPHTDVYAICFREKARDPVGEQWVSLMTPPFREELLRLPFSDTHFGAAFSPDGRYLAIGDRSGLVSIWEFSEVVTGVRSFPESTSALAVVSRDCARTVLPTGRFAGVPPAE